ncbi:MAG: hypothetical protein ACJ0SL_05235 [Candidatus Rariloculaceae bacterium]
MNAKSESSWLSWVAMLAVVALLAFAGLTRLHVRDFTLFLFLVIASGSALALLLDSTQRRGNKSN